MGKTNQLGVLADVFVTDASNNVGIGGSPSGSYKLEVTGTAKVSGILTLGSTISNGTYAYTLPSATGTLALTSALGDYLPLAGGTLTGALSGTSASLSSTVAITLTASDSRIIGGNTTGRLLLGNSGTTTYAIFNGATNAIPNTILLTTDNTERMRITTNGDLYIGTTSTINSNSSVFQMAFDNNTRTGMALKGTAAGSFGAIYFYNNSGTLQGSISSNGTGTTFYNTNSSDVRLKKNFEKWDENVSDKFFQLEPKLFNYLTDEDGTNKTKGYIANDAVKDFPEAYPLGQDGYYSFNPSGMTVYLMKAIQELNERLNKAGL